MYYLKIKPNLEKKLKKLKDKIPKQLNIILKKTKKITENPLHYKNLRNPLHELKRVQIDHDFILIFSVDETKKTITLQDYEHRDSVYIK